MYKAYKFRLYPNDNQKILINKTFGCTRFIYNHFLNKCKEEKFIKAYEMCKELLYLIFLTKCGIISSLIKGDFIYEKI